MTTATACLDGPFSVELKISYVSEDGTVAQAAYDLPPGIVPTDEAIRHALDTVRETMKDYPDFRPMTRHEFVNSILPSVPGGEWAVGGPDSFRLDAPKKTG